LSKAAATLLKIKMMKVGMMTMMMMMHGTDGYAWRTDTASGDGFEGNGECTN
jgi:hypothetical protein